MITIVAKSVFTESNREEALKVYSKLREETLKEEGCSQYKLHYDINEPNAITLIEIWDTQENIDKHIESSHYKEFVPQIRTFRIDSELNFYKNI